MMATGLSLSYLETHQIVLLVVAGSCLLTSMAFGALRKYNAAIAFLTAFAFCAFFSAALFDPFLHLWDERFHAIVAKNMITDPLRPALYQTQILEHQKIDWSTQDVWLHKQPLFMWQMAIAMKIFGCNEWAARLPDVLLGTLLVLVIYRCGKLLRSESMGYIAALLFAGTGFLYELASGKQMLDHNDFVFVAYVSMSIWAWIEYSFTKRKRWMVLIGMFTGFAVLCKWMPGLFVYLIWGIQVLLAKPILLNKFREMLLSLVITAVIVLPWQIYILLQFPEIAAQDFALNTRHFFEVIEGHDGSVWFHFLMMNEILGYGALVLIPIAWIFVLVRGQAKTYWLPMLLGCVFVYAFFTLAKTKMPAFTALTLLPALLALAFLIDSIAEQLFQRMSIPVRAFVLPLLFIALTVWRLEPMKLAANHGMTRDPGGYWLSMRHNAEIWRHMMLPENGVIFHATHGTYLECMFYTGRPAYDFIPDQSQLDILADKGLVAVIIDASEITLPEYFSAYSFITDDQVIMKEY
jgi:4-amino-4-deoxy-L-arabinose transferase